MTNTPPPPGWYLDPRDNRVNRWWDGLAWTEHSALVPQTIGFQPQLSGKSMVTAYLLLIFLGGLGLHRFYLGRPGSASILLTLTIVAAIFGATTGSGVNVFLVTVWIWTFVDLFLVPGMVRSTRAQ
jgi:TM2 domain-containing membrane protein YozV